MTCEAVSTSLASWLMLLMVLSTTFLPLLASASTVWALAWASSVFAATSCTLLLSSASVLIGGCLLFWLGGKTSAQSDKLATQPT